VKVKVNPKVALLKMKRTPRVRVLSLTRGKRMEKNPKKVLVMGKAMETKALRETLDQKGILVKSPEEVERNQMEQRVSLTTEMVLRLEKSLDPDPLVILPKENLMDYLRRTPKRKGARRVR
jgi:hypothetical protein